MNYNYLGLLIAVTLFYSCGSSKIDQSVVLKNNLSADAVDRPIKLYKKPSDIEGISEILASNDTQFTEALKVQFLMDYLASDELKGRDIGSKGIALAADFIETIFVKNGVAPYYATYRDTITNFETPAYNIIGMVEGNDEKLKDEYIIIGAHYDHIGLIGAKNDSIMQTGIATDISMNGNTENDIIANGANDNASGTTTVLELARYFGTTRTNKRSILFVLFSAEEKNLVGSKYLAQKLKQEGLNLYTVINYEMDGVPMKSQDYLLYVTGYEKSNLAQVVNRYSKTQYVGNLPKANEFNLFMRSDNFPFYEQFNVPSHTFSSFDFTNFDHYHKVGDEVSEIDFEHMANVINRSIPVIEGISNATLQEIKNN